MQSDSAPAARRECGKCIIYGINPGKGKCNGGFPVPVICGKRDSESAVMDGLLYIACIEIRASESGIGGLSAFCI